MYWNMVLEATSRSTWGWMQNMLVSINKKEMGHIDCNNEVLQLGTLLVDDV